MVKGTLLWLITIAGLLATLQLGYFSRYQGRGSRLPDRGSYLQPQKHRVGISIVKIVDEHAAIAEPLRLEEVNGSGHEKGTPLNWDEDMRLNSEPIRNGAQKGVQHSSLMTGQLTH
eukprot:1136101-Rhodomonas_salina.1